MKVLLTIDAIYLYIKDMKQIWNHKGLIAIYLRNSEQLKNVKNKVLQ